MPGAVVVFSVALAIIVIVMMEVIAAVLPVVVVILLVPPHERAGLAELIAAADSSRRLRMWPALRVAVRARRQSRVVRQSRAAHDVLDELRSDERIIQPDGQR